MIGRALKAIAALFALAAAASLSACNDADIRVGSSNGVPLAELDVSGEPPRGVVLGGPDTVEIVEGADFAIDVEGSAAARERMRFHLEDGILAIGRAQGDWDDGDLANVTIAMPAPSSLVLGGSGRISTYALRGDSEIVVGGSGSLVARDVEASALSVVIAGSGSANVAGTADSLEMVVGGSGNADMAELRVDSADVNVAGSGDASFASDGTVSANIAGSGEVRVTGSAQCEVNSIGSGELVCGAANEDDAASEAA